MEAPPAAGATLTIRLLQARFRASSGPGVELTFLLYTFLCAKQRRASCKWCSLIQKKSAIPSICCEERYTCLRRDMRRSNLPHGGWDSA